VTPTADDVRALARSSPWLWTTLHFTHLDAEGETEAWLRRPGRLLVVGPDGREERVVEEPRGSTTWRWPQEVEPARRPDGLVVTRPDDPVVEYGDPMYRNYQWVAMLDPVELSHGVEITGVRTGEHRGRPTWEARVRALEGYDPTCGCCPLVWSEVSDRLEYDDGSGRWEPPRGTAYPEAYDVALDVTTGVVVRSQAVGGDPRCDLEVVIHEVDGPMERV